MAKHVRDLDAEHLFAGVNDPDPAEPLTRFTADVRATLRRDAGEPDACRPLQAMTETTPV